jgi:hypothetical protein
MKDVVDPTDDRHHLSRRQLVRTAGTAVVASAVTELAVSCATAPAASAATPTLPPPILPRGFASEARVSSW